MAKMHLVAAFFVPAGTAGCEIIRAQDTWWVSCCSYNLTEEDLRKASRYSTKTTIQLIIPDIDEVHAIAKGGYVTAREMEILRAQYRELTADAYSVAAE